MASGLVNAVSAFHRLASDPEKWKDAVSWRSRVLIFYERFPWPRAAVGFGLVVHTEAGQCMREGHFDGPESSGKHKRTCNAVDAVNVRHNLSHVFLVAAMSRPVVGFPRVLNL